MTANPSHPRKAPFLHRNWLKGVRAWQDPSAMGNIASSPERKGVGDGGDRPLKKRRISTSNSFDVDHLIASPRTSDPRSALRIEVLKLAHKETKKIRPCQTTAAPRDLLTTKASCRITISELSSGRPRVLHCQSQICDLTTFKNPVGPHRTARVDLPRPFYIPEESILINRSDDAAFDLSDSYELLVELEAANDGHWPPLEITDFGIPAVLPQPPSNSTRNWVLSSRFDKIFGRLKGPLSLSSGYPSHQYARETDYILDVDLSWTAGFKALRRLEKGSMPCINAIDPDTDLFTNDADAVPNVANGQHMDESSFEIDEELEEAQTPSRSLRTREKNKVYNLKVLSDQAQGKEKKRRIKSTSTATAGGRINYLLPSDQPVSLDYFRCVTCGVYHHNMLQLQVHLQTLHTGYEYVLETTSQGPQFRVTSRCESESSPSKTYLLKQPIQPFNLETIASGDQSWITSRLGPDARDDVFLAPRDRSELDRLPSRSPMPPHRSTMQCRGQSSRPRGTKAVVPPISQPVFDPISRVKLVAGQEVPRYEYAPDNTWLIQKHREAIGDFSDVTPPEKEYIWEWDGYILCQNITSAVYLPRAWLEFVRQKASWLVAANSRMLEFGKHTSVLLARDVLDEDSVEKALSHINEARAKSIVKLETNGLDGVISGSGVTKTPTKQSPKNHQIRKGSNGCGVCQLPVLGPRMLLCSNKVCAP